MRFPFFQISLSKRNLRRYTEQLKSGKKAAAPNGRGQSGSFDRAVALAESAEAREGTDSDLGFTCTILLLGKSGVGKSSTINSLLGEGTAAANAFAKETTKAGRMYKWNAVDPPDLESRLVSTLEPIK
jgi:ribosome biogenesis GTPase A